MSKQITVTFTETERIAINTLSHMYVDKMDEKADMSNPVLVQVKATLQSIQKKLV